MPLEKIDQEDEKYIHKLIDYLKISELLIEIWDNNYTSLTVTGYKNTLDCLINNLRLCAYGKLNLPFVPEGKDHIDLVEIIIENPDGNVEYFTHTARIKLGKTFVDLKFDEWD
jgi:hypothetical protein